MTVRQLSRLLREWVSDAGLDPKKYGMESLRRTKTLHILNATGDIEAVRVLLGHTKIESSALPTSSPKDQTQSQFLSLYSNI